MQCPDCGASPSSNAIAYAVVAEFERKFGKARDWDAIKYAAYQEKRHLYGKILGDVINNQRDLIWWERYNAYLLTEQWLKLSLRIKRRADFICEWCHVKPVAHTHHLTYDRCGEELETDLAALCLECHKIAHPDKTTWATGSSHHELVSAREKDDKDLPW